MKKKAKIIIPAARLEEFETADGQVSLHPRDDARAAETQRILLSATSLVRIHSKDVVGICHTLTHRNYLS